jgi:hypothetical protein
MMMTMNFQALILKVRKTFLRKDYLGNKWKSKLKKRIEELQPEDRVRTSQYQIKKEDPLIDADELPHTHTLDVAINLMS